MDGVCEKEGRVCFCVGLIGCEGLVLDLWKRVSWEFILLRDALGE